MKSVLTVVLSLGLGLGLGAQELNISAKLDSNSILIGEQFTLSIEGIASKGENFIWPLLPDTLEGLEIISASKIDSIEKKDFYTLRQKFVITSFDSGYFLIPPLEIRQGGMAAQTEALAVAVGFPELSEEDNYFDVKAILEPGLNWYQILLFSGISLLVFAALIFLYIRVNKKKVAAVKAPKYILKPYAQAYKDLADLEKQQLWQKGEIKKYYSRLTDILKYYLERQLGISALERTADEIIESVQTIRMTKDFYEDLKAMLKTSSFVKFAKAKPGPFENEQAIRIVKEFIDITKPKPQVKKELNDD